MLKNGVLAAIAAGLLLALACSAEATAGNLDIQPTTLLLSPSKPTGVLRLANRGSQDATYQLRVFGWTQRNGENSLEPTQGMLASPAIFTLPPGQQQLIRLHHRGQLSQPGEAAYRVLIDELPQRSPEAGTLSVLVQLSLPVFVRSGPDSLAPRLAVQPVFTPGEMRVRVQNQGTITAKLGKAAFKPSSGSGHMVEELRYILPGSFTDFRLPRGMTTRMAVDLLTDQGWQHFDLDRQP